MVRGMGARKKRVVAWSQYALIAAGLSALAYYAIAFGEATRYQAIARDQVRKASVVAIGPITPPTSVAASISKQVFSGEMAPLGRIDVPRAHISAMVAEGTSPTVLRVAVGHLPGTAVPGEAGNIVLAAHRDTFFRHLGQLKTGDVIRLIASGRQYVYTVTFTDIVSPNETWVLEPSSVQSLTLVTCYPFYYVGPAPKRFVVRARRTA